MTFNYLTWLKDKLTNTRGMEDKAWAREGEILTQKTLPKEGSRPEKSDPALRPIPG